MPINALGEDGIISNEVRGTATSPIILSLDNAEDESHAKGSLFNLSGQITSVKTDQPIDNTILYATIKELNMPLMLFNPISVILTLKLKLQRYQEITPFCSALTKIIMQLAKH